MNNCLRTRQLLNLIWIENQGYWVYHCTQCRKTELEKKGGNYE